MSKVFQYLVLFTVHQPQYLVDSNRAMNLCILHKYLRYNILWLILRKHTIYSHAARSARFAVSRALCVYRYSLPAAFKTCDTARLSPSCAMLCTDAVAVQHTAHDTAYSPDSVQIAQKKLKNVGFFVQFFVRSMNFFFATTIYCARTGENALFSAEKHNILWSSKTCNPVREVVSYGCSKRTALSTAPLHHPSIRAALVAPRVPCQVNNAQLKPLTCTASAQRR